jgi:acyl carrier protein
MNDERAHADELIEYIKQQVMRRPNADVTADTPLVSSGLIDSFALVDILAKLEDVTNTRISTGKVQPKDMDTVNLMLQTAKHVGKPRRLL